MTRVPLRLLMLEHKFQYRQCVQWCLQKTIVNNHGKPVNQFIVHMYIVQSVISIAFFVYARWSEVRSWRVPPLLMVPSAGSFHGVAIELYRSTVLYCLHIGTVMFDVL